MKEEIDKQKMLESFSLGVGGPLYWFLEKMGLLKKPLLFYKRRIVVISLLTWFPLFLLTLLGGVAFSGVEIPFLRDVEVHVRFLLVLSMLIYAEVVSHDRLRVIVEQFLKCNIIAAHDRSRFQQIIVSAMRMRDSVVIEILLIVVVYTVGHWISREYLPLGASSWFAISEDNIATLRPAGYWYVFVSLPIFQFILLRWYFRVAIWYFFLWRVSRLPLKLNSLHPDRAGGLGFLANSIYALEPFLLAHSVLLSGMIFNRIWNGGAVISDFHMTIVGVLIFILIIPLVPLFFFIFQMIKEKRMGTINYSAVANRYVNEFRQKWIGSSSENHEPLLGTSDIQSLADLANSFEVSNKMRVLPFGRNSMMVLVILTALPLLPLLLTVIPLDKMIRQIFGLIF